MITLFILFTSKSNKKFYIAECNFEDLLILICQHTPDPLKLLLSLIYFVAEVSDSGPR